jgi:hypothetical protein
MIFKIKAIYRVHPVNPVKKPYKAHFNTIYLCNLCNLWFLVLQNKPNFPNFDLKMRGSAENKPNFISKFSILNSQFRSPRLRNEPNLHPHIPPADYFLYFTMSVNRG